MDYQLLAIIIAIIIATTGWTIAIYQWRREHVLNAKNLNLKIVETAPHLNIVNANLYFNDDNECVVKLHVNNTGKSTANFPKWKWEYTLKNGKKFESTWYDIEAYAKNDFDEYEKNPYLKPYHRHRCEDSFRGSNNLDEIDLLLIKVIYSDNLNIKWGSKAFFKKLENKWLLKNKLEGYRIDLSRRKRKYMDFR